MSNPRTTTSVNTPLNNAQIFEPLQSFNTQTFIDHHNPITYEQKSALAMTFLENLEHDEKVDGLSHLYENNKQLLEFQAQKFLDMARSSSATTITKPFNGIVTHLYNY